MVDEIMYVLAVDGNSIKNGMKKIWYSSHNKPRRTYNSNYKLLWSADYKRNIQFRSGWRKVIYSQG